MHAVCGFIKVLFIMQATATVVPQQWQPNSGLLMTNDVSGVNLEEATPCIALSKNDSYVMSAAGGKISLFNMMTFKVYIYIYIICTCTHEATSSS